MKKKILGLVLLMTLVATPANAIGLFYTNATYPLMATGVKTTKSIDCLKKGEASAKSILGIIELGDAGVKAATKNGDLKQVYYIDVHQKSIFVFFKKVTTLVYGE